MLRFLALVGLCALVACGGDKSTGPSIPNLGGKWLYSMTNVTGNGVTCFSTDTIWSINQSGTTFSGAYSIQHRTCTRPDGSAFEVRGVSGAVVNGTISGTAVTFDFDSPDWHNTGTLSGWDPDHTGTPSGYNLIKGTTTLRIADGPNTYVVRGTFEVGRCAPTPPGLPPLCS